MVPHLILKLSVPHLIRNYLCLSCYYSTAGLPRHLIGHTCQLRRPLGTFKLYKLYKLCFPYYICRYITVFSIYFCFSISVMIIFAKVTSSCLLNFENAPRVDYKAIFRQGPLLDLKVFMCAL